MLGGRRQPCVPLPNQGSDLRQGAEPSLERGPAGLWRDLVDHVPVAVPVALWSRPAPPDTARRCGATPAHGARPTSAPVEASIRSHRGLGRRRGETDAPGRVLGRRVGRRRRRRRCGFPARRRSPLPGPCGLQVVARGARRPARTAELMRGMPASRQAGTGGVGRGSPATPGSWARCPTARRP